MRSFINANGKQVGFLWGTKDPISLLFVSFGYERRLRTGKRGLVQPTFSNRKTHHCAKRFQLAIRRCNAALFFVDGWGLQAICAVSIDITRCDISHQALTEVSNQGFEETEHPLVCSHPRDLSI